PRHCPRSDASTHGADTTRVREGNHLTIVSISDGADGRRRSQFMMLNHETETYETFITSSDYLRSRFGLIQAISTLPALAVIVLIVAIIASMIVVFTYSAWIGL